MFALNGVALLTVSLNTDPGWQSTTHIHAFLCKRLDWENIPLKKTAYRARFSTGITDHDNVQWPSGTMSVWYTLTHSHIHIHIHTPHTQHTHTPHIRTNCRFIHCCKCLEETLKLTTAAWRKVMIFIFGWWQLKISHSIEILIIPLYVRGGICCSVQVKWKVQQHVRHFTQTFRSKMDNSIFGFSVSSKHSFGKPYSTLYMPNHLELSRKHSGPEHLSGSKCWRTLTFTQRFPRQPRSGWVERKNNRSGSASYP